MRFVADSMLGKLARWLRILGHDVEYSAEIDDSGLISVAKKGSRVLLTRDLALFKQAKAKGVEAFFCELISGEEKLAALAERFDLHLNVDMERSRCPKCNARVKPMDKREAEGQVEENTFANYNDFWKCPKCGQVYWQGAHWQRIEKTLTHAKDLLKMRSKN